MAKQYPNIGSASKSKKWMANPKGAPMCMAKDCSLKATHRVEVQVNWFRGDDECGNACDAHKLDAAAMANGIPAYKLMLREKQLAAEAKKTKATS